MTSKAAESNTEAASIRKARRSVGVPMPSATRVSRKARASGFRRSTMNAKWSKDSRSVPACSMIRAAPIALSKVAHAGVSSR